MDSNGDDAISYAEMEAAALKRFDRADSNGDGQLTADERAAARSKFRDGKRGKHHGGDHPMPEMDD